MIVKEMIVGALIVGATIVGAMINVNVNNKLLFFVLHT